MSEREREYREERKRRGWRERRNKGKRGEERTGRGEVGERAGIKRGDEEERLEREQE